LRRPELAAGCCRPHRPLVALRAHRNRVPEYSLKSKPPRVRASQGGAPVSGDKLAYWECFHVGAMASQERDMMLANLFVRNKKVHCVGSISAATRLHILRQLPIAQSVGRIMAASVLPRLQHGANERRALNVTSPCHRRARATSRRYNLIPSAPSPAEHYSCLLS